MMKPKKASVTVRDVKRTIEDWCTLRAAMRHQESSIQAGRKDLGVFVRYCKEKNVRRITGLTLINFFTYLRDARKNDSGAINRKRSTLRCYFDHLRLRQVPGADRFPVEHLPRARQAYKGPIQTLEYQEVIKLLSSIDRSTLVGQRDFTVFSLLYAIGLRLGECLGLRMEDIDWKKEMLTINGKGRKIRYIPLTEKITNLLKSWMLCRNSFLNAKTSEYIFLSKKGNRLSLRTAEEHFQEIVNKAGPFTMKKVTPHSLRHAFASHAIDGNADLLVLKTLLGHASIKTTELYLHPSVNSLRKALNDHLSSDILHAIRCRGIGVFRFSAGKKVFA
jgi:site-specific recombinase XerD